MRVITFTTDMMESHMYLAEEDGHVLLVDPADYDVMIEAIVSVRFAANKTSSGEVKPTKLTEYY